MEEVCKDCMNDLFDLNFSQVGGYSKPKYNVYVPCTSNSLTSLTIFASPQSTVRN